MELFEIFLLCAGFFFAGIIIGGGLMIGSAKLEAYLKRDPDDVPSVLSVIDGGNISDLDPELLKRALEVLESETDDRR